MIESDAHETEAIDWEKTGLKSLREVLERIRRECIAARRSKREISHDLANGFLYTLPKSATIIERPAGNANYFFMKIGGVVWGVTPFGSLEKCWDEPSEGFRQSVKARACRWGVIFFDIEREGSWEGLWIEGPDFDEKVLRGREAVSSEMIRKARGKRIVHSFTESEQFIHFITNPPRKPGEPYVIRKTRK
jgi:hypothetical protein